MMRAGMMTALLLLWPASAWPLLGAGMAVACPPVCMVEDKGKIAEIVEEDAQESWIHKAGKALKKEAMKLVAKLKGESADSLHEGAGKAAEVKAAAVEAIVEKEKEERAAPAPADFTEAILLSAREVDEPRQAAIRKVYEFTRRLHDLGVKSSGWVRLDMAEGEADRIVTECVETRTAVWDEFKEMLAEEGEDPAEDDFHIDDMKRLMIETDVLKGDEYDEALLAARVITQPVRIMPVLDECRVQRDDSRDWAAAEGVKAQGSLVRSTLLYALAPTMAADGDASPMAAYQRVADLPLSIPSDTEAPEWRKWAMLKAVEIRLQVDRYIASLRRESQAAMALSVALNDSPNPYDRY